MILSRATGALRLFPLLSLAIIALATLVETGCSSGGGGDLYDDGFDNIRDTREPTDK